MSRSCQRATFSSEARAFVRTSRARPATCSQPTGLRLWGIAEEPFCPEPNGSSTSRTSVFWRARISVANFSRLAATRARVGHHLGVAVALQDLGRDRGGPQPEPRAHRLLDVGGQVREGPHRARELAHRDRGPRAVEAAAGGAAAPRTRGRASGRRSSARRGRRGCARSSACACGARPAPAPPSIRSTRSSRTRSQASRMRIGEGGVHDVGGREAVVQPPPLGADALGHAGDEGDHVVLDLLLDLLDAGRRRSGPARLIAARASLGDDAALRQHLGGGDLDLEPGGEAVLVGPQARHLRARVAGDHG